MATQIARSIGSYKVIVEKSTVPVYTNQWIRRVVERNGTSSANFDVASNPEFLREGTAVTDFLHPDRIVIGADSEQAASILKSIYAPPRASTTAATARSSDPAPSPIRRPSCSPPPKRPNSSNTPRTPSSR